MERQQRRRRNVEKNLKKKKSSRKTIEIQCNNLTSHDCVQNKAFFFQQLWFDVCAMHTQCYQLTDIGKNAKKKGHEPCILIASTFANRVIIMLKQNLYLNCMLWSFRCVRNFIYLYIGARKKKNLLPLYRSHSCWRCYCVRWISAILGYFAIFTANLHNQVYGKINKTRCYLSDEKKNRKISNFFHPAHRRCVWKKKCGTYAVKIWFDLKLTIIHMENAQCFNWRKFITPIRYISLTNYLLLFTIVFCYDLCHKLNVRTSFCWRRVCEHVFQKSKIKNHQFNAHIVQLISISTGTF